MLLKQKNIHDLIIVSSYNYSIVMGRYDTQLQLEELSLKVLHLIL